GTGDVEDDREHVAQDELLGEVLAADGDLDAFERLVVLDAARIGRRDVRVHRLQAAAAGRVRPEHRDQADGGRADPGLAGRGPQEAHRIPLGRAIASTTRPSQSTRSASADTSVAPPMSTFSWLSLMPAVIMLPSPPAPTNAARVAVPTMSTRASRTPARITGTA